MLPPDAPEVVRAVCEAVEASPVVQSVMLGGSRAEGRATELSDWDLYLAGEPDKLMAEIPELVAPLRPLASFWEPLSEHAGYMMVMDGPVKIDLFPEGGRRELQPPWEPRPDTLAAIDGHFWDWHLWLGSKSLRHETDMVAQELAKMKWFLLGPLGVEQAPGSLDEAVAVYLTARREASRRFGTPVADELRRQVIGALRRYRLVS